MTTLEDLEPGLRLAGVVPGQSVTVIQVQAHGDDAIELTYKTADGGLGQRVLGRSAEPRLSVARAEARPFDADAGDFKLVAECQRITLAGLFDPMLAVTTSDIRPLPHQLRAVYGELLPRTPLRFLLADDPGAGKTIMAGLYAKELLLREDVKRCLIVAPGGLVEQWQDELFQKFGLAFEILSPQMGDGPFGVSAFERNPLVIARMDQLARNEELLNALQASEWDLVIVDEAHRMGAHWFGGKLEKTKRFQLGELLGGVARHLLLMTATPHNGKEEDFQLFLTLLDRDRFEGRYRASIHNADTAGLMRRMVKEDLLTFEGTPLFPERIAETVPYRLNELEQELYEQVTTYVREGMNRADALDGKRRNTVGFALTVLQRRLASSPEAIYRSLERRAVRLERRKQDLLDGRAAAEPPSVDLVGGLDELDDDEFSAEELEQIEDELVDAATAARTVEELDSELIDLRLLIVAAERVRNSQADRKWAELRTILEDNTLATSQAGERRKLIVFTEHRDTLDYLARRIAVLLSRPGAVRAIHGGVRRAERRRITEEFTRNPDCQVLLATDAAGEGLNLQAAHLMVNYDLPWNPNRIEQRFGRIHRIGQREVCRLWNLVADNTREGEVFVRLLSKIEEQRKAYGGKVFDVLGVAFTERPLRDLLIEAIRYGDLPETRAGMERVIDASVAHGITEMLAEEALASDALAAVDIAGLRELMDEARARRLQPHYIEGAFRSAFAGLGGRIRRRERGRFEITHVPARVRAAARGPVATRYERVTFDIDDLEEDVGARAALLAPGHPLHDAVIDETLKRLRPALERGTVLVSPDVQEPRLLVGVVQEVVDATEASISKRFAYAYIDASGGVEAAGPAPYLDCVAAPPVDAVDRSRRLPWLTGAEDSAASWVIANELPGFVTEVTKRREAELRRLRDQVERRLAQERERLIAEAIAAAEQERNGKKPREGEASLLEKAADLDRRLTARMELLDRQLEMQATSPRIVTAALVLPLDAVESELPADAPVHAVSTKEVERRGVERVLAAERALGRVPVEQAFNNPGFDVLSRRAGEDPIRIEVKARLAGADDFYVTHNEVLTALNSAPHYRLALVCVDSRGPQHDEVCYVESPFGGFDAGSFAATGHRGDWDMMWARGRKPF
ncbi:helicase-related protein [Miltoncostaea oceani]|uniref:helicase-related protein n=1 Tax=Miltoncostaea oceani TaxID=2843216 RepID=UPI001C3D055A|nr:helicase-related protein [Miltoncostaea oceani]